MLTNIRGLLFGVFLCFGTALFAQNTGTSGLPQELVRPRYGEDPRFPKDYVIGELGRGGATEETYQLARQIVAGLAAGNGNVDQVVFPEYKRIAAVNKLNALGVRSWRVGGGRSEGAGGYSFLVRFLGRERSITGELYLQWEEPRPVIVEEPVAAEPAPDETEEAEPVSTLTEEETAEEEPVTGAETAAETTAITETVAAEKTGAVEFTVPAESSGAGANTTVTPVVKEEDEPRWRVDDILLESPRSLSDGKFSPGGADMTPYERFF
jgi:hypothetical protein